MTPAAIIKEAMADGVNLALSPAGAIKACGETAVVNRWLPTIRQHKAEIVAALQDAANDAPIPADLERLIRRASLIYEHSSEDNTLMLDLARKDPQGLRLALTTDPLLKLPAEWDQAISFIICRS